MECWTRRLWLALAMWLAAAMAQTITPSNWSMADTSQEGDDYVQLSISTGPDMVPVASVYALTSKGRNGIPAPGVTGIAILTNYTNQLNLNGRDVAVMSCDAAAYVGNIGVMDVFGTAISNNVTGVVLYTQTADFCNLEGYSGSFSWIYSMKNRTDTARLLDGLGSYTQSAGEVYLTVSQADASSTTSSSAASTTSASNNLQPNPLGPSPTTAVAMVILYSITGLITALFLVIIVTGAVRAHRHPERYGPRNVLGRPRQSRARGLARAMLDTIPIVKFGERQEEPKSADVELADTNAHAGATVVAETQNSTDSQQARKVPAATADTVPENNARGDAFAGQASSQDGGIAPATPVLEHDTGAARQVTESEGCSICTEDFQRGEDQRVLPCDHRFHPACIDPWLLNVSGTCPLCRIDLRPQESRPSAEGENNEQAGETETAQSEPVPPLDRRRERQTSLRENLVRSWMHNMGNSERMTREERILALREYRGRAAAATQTHETRQSEPREGAEVPEAERRLRTRLRNAFRVRTRRAGQEEPVVAEGGEAATVPEEVPETLATEGTSSGPSER